VFFSIGSTIATSLVPKEKAASAIAIMFGGLTVAGHRRASGDVHRSTFWLA
jgi:predicted MFS family arabinose efflux permease